MPRASLLYDIESDVIVDAKLEPLAVDERTLAEGRIEASGELGLHIGSRKPLVIFDRGYPSKDLVDHLQDEEIRCVMRVQRGFDFRIDKMKGGSEVIKLSEGMKTRAIAFRLRSGGREAPITSMEEGETAGAVFPELYYKRWPIEAKYNQVKRKIELENFSGRLVDNIKRDFYAMMTVSNMLASSLREANRKGEKAAGTKERKYECRANANHAVGALKGRLIGMLMADDRFVSKHLYGELAGEIKRRVVPLRPNREVRRKKYLKNLFSSQSQIKLLSVCVMPFP
jgi:hypothetical protein